MEEPEPDRKAQIVGAALHLLAELSLDDLTTRRLAAELGLSQPALFRHFATRDEIVLAVVARVRSDLQRVAAQVLAGRGPVAGRLRDLGRALLGHVRTHPGFPRLLFAAALPGAGPIREAMRHIVSSQSALVAELVREGQAAGELASDVRPDDASALFVGFLQGLVLRWECSGRLHDPAAGFDGGFSLWLRSLDPAGRPAIAATAGHPRIAGTPGRSLLSLDAVPMIRGGTDPLTAILDAVARLPHAGALAVRAPFRPAPLLTLLTSRGHAVHDEPLDGGHWLILVLSLGSPPLENLTDLEPPEPLERVLSRSTTLAPGHAYLARLPRFPTFLLQRLAERGIQPEVETLPDNTALLRIVRAP